MQKRQGYCLWIVGNDFSNAAFSARIAFDQIMFITASVLAEGEKENTTYNVRMCFSFS